MSDFNQNVALRSSPVRQWLSADTPVPQRWHFLQRLFVSLLAAVLVAVVAGAVYLVWPSKSASRVPVAAPQSHELPLVGTTWKLTGWTVDGQTASIGPSRLFQFSADNNGELQGQDGCNQTHGTATTTATDIVIHDYATTDMACTASQRQIADHVDQVWSSSGTLHWTITGPALTLTRGANTLIYQASSG